jgi:hypothetical protein
MSRRSVQDARDWNYFNALSLSRAMLRSRMNSAVSQLRFARMMKDDASVSRILQELEDHKRCLRMIFETRPK